MRKLCSWHCPASSRLFESRFRLLTSVYKHSSIRLFDMTNVSWMNTEMEREQEQQLYRMQADLCQTMVDPTRLEMLSLLGEGPKAVKDLVALLGLRQAKVSQHLALLRQRRIVRAERVGNEMHYSLVDARILEACLITREILLQQLTQQGTLATVLAGARES